MGVAPVSTDFGIDFDSAAGKVPVREPQQVLGHLPLAGQRKQLSRRYFA
jgi:hypothetical protein